MFRKFDGKFIAYTGVLTALAVVCNMLTIMLAPNKAISFVYVPSFIAGMTLGPIAGLIVGGLGDVLGHIIAPKGDFMVLITLSSALIGFIPGVVYWLLGKFNAFGNVHDSANPQQLITKRIITCIVISLFLCIVTSSVLNTYATWLKYASKSKTFWIYFVGRLPIVIANTLVNGFITISIIPTLINDYKVVKA